MDIETKLQRFSEGVLKEAEDFKNKRLGIIDKKYETGVGSFEKRAVEKYGEMVADITISAERKKQKSIAQKNAEVKKALILKRVNYINAIFDDILQRLDAFFKTPEYEDLIVGHIERYKSGGGDPSEMAAYVMERDIALKDSIEKRTGVSVFSVDEDFLGGVKILLGKNRIADCTLKKRLESEKMEFNKIKII